MNRLLFGDNLKWLQDTKVFPDGSVDLVYLDPPFNSNANYNVLFKEASGAASQARAEQLGKLRDDLVSFRDPQGVANGSERSQFHAFTDTWEWTREVDDTLRRTQGRLYRQFVDTCPNARVIEPCPEPRRMVEALKKFLKPSQTRRAAAVSAQTSPMMAYLAMMAPRLVELHRVLKPTGSLYLHN